MLGKPTALTGRTSSLAAASGLAGVATAVWLLSVARPAAVLQRLEIIWPWVVAVVLLAWVMILLGAAAIVVGGNRQRLTPTRFAAQLQRALKARVNLTRAFAGSRETPARFLDPGCVPAWNAFTAPALSIIAASGVALIAKIPRGGPLEDQVAIPPAPLFAVTTALALGAVALMSGRSPGSAYNVAWAKGVAAPLALRQWLRRRRDGQGVAFSLGIAAQILAVASLWLLARPLYAHAGVGEIDILLAALVLAGTWRFASLLGALVPGAIGVAEVVLAQTAVSLGLSLADALALAIALRAVEAVPTLAGWVLVRLEASGAYEHQGESTAEDTPVDPPVGSRTMPSCAIVVLESSSRKGGVWAATKIAGLPLVERCVRGLARAGVEEIICWSPDDTGTGLDSRLERRVEEAARKERVRLSWVTSAAGVPATMLPGAADGGAHRGDADPQCCVVVPAWVSWSWRGLRDAVRSGSGNTAFDGGNPATSERSGSAHADGIARLQRGPCVVSTAAAGPFWHPVERAADAAEVTLEDESWTVVGDTSSRRGAERALFALIYKASDGVHARANRRISLLISSLLLHTPVTANVVTLMVLGVSLAGAAVIATASWPALLLGSALVYLACMLDGVDGEIARLKFQESDFGCWLDTVGDYIFYVVTIGAFGWAVYVRQGHSPFFGAVAIATWSGMVVTLLVLTWQRSRMEKEPHLYNEKIEAAFDARAESLSYYFLRHTYGFGKRSTMPYYMFVFVFLRWEVPLLLLIFLMANVYWPAALLLGRRGAGGSGMVKGLPSNTF